METLKQLLTDIFSQGKITEEPHVTPYNHVKCTRVTITTANGRYTFIRSPGDTNKDIMDFLLKRGKRQERLMNTRFDTKSRQTTKTEPTPQHHAEHWLFFFTDNQTNQPKNVS